MGNSAQTPPIGQKEECLLVAAPRDYFLGPIFAASPQTGGREVTIGNTRYLVGGFHPIADDSKPLPPALDVRHGRAAFVLLSFRSLLNPTRLIRFSFNEFCRRYARSQGGRYAQDIAKILRTLMDSYIRTTNLLTRIVHEYRLLEHIDIEKRPIRRKDDKRANADQLEMWFNGCTLSEEFYNLLTNIVELQHLKLDVLTSIRNPLAQAIYLYIPSRAHHHTEINPFEITLTTLLEQVSHPVPQHKSVRKKFFTQRRTSILSQLDGLETLSGIFRVRLAETTDGEDWKLQCWVEKPSRGLPPAVQSRKLADSKMVKAFLTRTGKTIEQVKQRLENVEPFSEYEEELFRRAGIKLNGNEKAFELAKALLGETRFNQLLSEAKGEMLEGRAATKTPNHRLMSRIMEALREG